MGINVRKKVKNVFDKDFSKLIDNSLFENTMKNVRKHRDIKPNYDTIMFFTEHLLAIEIEKMQILMNKPVYLVLSILELSKILMYEFWYDYVKPK